MPDVVELWLPILVAAVLVFVASSLIHMVARYHKDDFGRLAGEDRVLEAMRADGVKPGSYRFPYCGTMHEMSTPEMTAKLDRGPVGTMTLIPPGPFSMGKALLQWFLFCLVVSLIVGYVGGLALPRGVDAMRVFRVTATAALLGYGFTSVMDSIWHGVRWGVTVKFVLDGIIYAVVSGATFAWLWPEAIAAG